MPPLTYTPYATAYRPFSIGLAPLDPARWIEPDDRLLAELALKDDLIATRRDVVFLARGDTRLAQAEIRDALVAHLLSHRETRYRRAGDAILIDDGARKIAPDDGAPILAASRLVQDDLCLMRRCDDGWRLVAASLCFPSSWSLKEKFDRPMGAIHEHVPGFAGGMAERVARIFDNLQPARPVWRLNWSIYDDDVLHHPTPKQGARKWAREGGFVERDAFVRVERQTLTKMPVSGDILFTIRNYLDPVAALRGHPRGVELALALRAQLLALNEAQLRYKGMLDDRDRIAATLKALAAA
jgi:hypothetical protein